jgi:SET domain-containing protein
MECTGLFHDFTKMNHSCVCNTSCIQSNNTISVSVSADRDIKKGEEITNSYINHSIKYRNTHISYNNNNIDNLNVLNSKLTKKQR